MTPPRLDQVTRLVQATLRRFTTSRALDADDARALLAITREALAALERIVLAYDSVNDPEPDEPDEIAEFALVRCAWLAASFTARSRGARRLRVTKPRVMVGSRGSRRRWVF